MKELAELLKALADETRLKILFLLSRQEMAVCEFINALKLSQPAVSHHLKILKQAGLIKDNREGKWIFYSINPESFIKCFNNLDERLFLPLKENLNNELIPSRIRSEPCLCEKLKQKSL